MTIKRGQGYGNILLEKGIELIREYYPTHNIRIEAQCQAQGFYEKHGFIAEGEPFLEDNIPHIEMILTFK